MPTEGSASGTFALLLSTHLQFHDSFKNNTKNANTSNKPLHINTARFLSILTAV